MKPAEIAVGPTDVVLLSDVERFVSRRECFKQVTEAATDGGTIITSHCLPTCKARAWLSQSQFYIHKNLGYGFLW